MRELSRRLTAFSGQVPCESQHSKESVKSLGCGCSIVVVVVGSYCCYSSGVILRYSKSCLLRFMLRIQRVSRIGELLSSIGLFASSFSQIQSKEFRQDRLDYLNHGDGVSDK